MTKQRNTLSVKSFMLIVLIMFPLMSLQGRTGDAATLPVPRQLIEDAKAGKIDRVKVSAWGFDPVDSTRFLQAAFDSGVPRIVIDLQASAWITTPLLAGSHQEILIEEGVEIVAKKGAFKGKRDSLITFAACEQTTLRGLGKGAVLRMNKKDYQSSDYERAEWRNCIAIRGAKNITVENMVLRESGGDGVCVGNVTARDFPEKKFPTNIPSENVVLRKLICDANHRQGMSICSVRNILIEDCVLKNTSGTAPQAGIDFEPDHAEHRLVNCVMRRCVSENNEGAGYCVYLPANAGAAEPVTITFDQCVSRSNRQSGFSAVLSAKQQKSLQGQLRVENCRFENDRGGNVYLAEKAEDGMKVSFNNCSIISRPEGEIKSGWVNDLFAPVRIESRSFDELAPGNIDFGNFSIRYQGKKPFLEYNDRSVNGFGLTGVTGNFDVEQNGISTKIKVDEQWCRTNYPVQDTRRIAAKSPLEQSWQPVFPDKWTGTQIFKSPMRISKPIDWLCYVTKGKEVRLSIRQYRFGRQIPQKVPVTITYPTGRKKRVELKATLDEETDITWTPTESGICRLTPGRGQHVLAVMKSNVPIVAATYPLLQFVRSPGDYYFYVPEGTKEFGVKVMASDYSPVKVTLFAPDGKYVDGKDHVNSVYAWYSPEGKQPSGGVWSIKLERTKTRGLVECSVALFGVPALIASSPDALLEGEF